MDGAEQHNARHAGGNGEWIDRPHQPAGNLPRYWPASARSRQHEYPAVDDHGLHGGHLRAGGDLRPARRHVRAGQDLQSRLLDLHHRLDPAELPADRQHRRLLSRRHARGAGDRRGHADGDVDGDPDRRVSAQGTRAGAGHQYHGCDRRPVHRPGAGRPACRHRLAAGVLHQHPGRRDRHDLGLCQPQGRRSRAQARQARLVGQHHLRGRPDPDPHRHQ